MVVDSGNTAYCSTCLVLMRAFFNLQGQPDRHGLRPHACGEWSPEHACILARRMEGALSQRMESDEDDGYGGEDDGKDDEQI